MKAFDLVELASRNLREAVLRNALTTLGVSVGVASLVAMLSLGAGLQQLAGKQLGRSGLFDTIIVTSRQDFRTQEERRENRSVTTTQMRTLDDKARAEMAGLPNVKEVYPEIRLMTELRVPQASGDPKSHYVMMGTLSSSARATEVFDELEGSFFSGPEAQEAIVLGEFGRELLELKDDGRPLNERELTTAQAKSLLGRELTMRYAERQAENSPDPAAVSAEDLGGFGFSVVRKELKLKIVGVVKDEPYGGTRGGPRTRIYIPTQLAEKLNMLQPTDLRTMMRPTEGKSYFTLVVRVTGPAQVKAVEDAIKRMGFTAYSILDASKQLERFFRIVDLFLAIFGSLALIVASLGIVNTLVMAILERRREIGIMKALGASDIDVKKLFFVEAGVMGLFGGLLGVGLGWAIGKAINLGTNVYLRSLELKPTDFWYVPWWLVVGALVFAVIVSLGAGLYPASRAARLDPVQALRHD